MLHICLGHCDWVKPSLRSRVWPLCIKVFSTWRWPLHAPPLASSWTCVHRSEQTPVGCRAGCARSPARPLVLTVSSWPGRPAADGLSRCAQSAHCVPADNFFTQNYTQSRSVLDACVAPATVWWVSLGLFFFVRLVFFADFGNCTPRMAGHTHWQEKISHVIPN